MRRLPKEIDDILVKHIRKYPRMKPPITNIAVRPKSSSSFISQLLSIWKQ